MSEIQMLVKEILVLGYKETEGRHEDGLWEAQIVPRQKEN